MFQPSQGLLLPVHHHNIPFTKFFRPILKTTCLCQQPGSVQGYGKEMATSGVDLGLFPWRATLMGLCGGSAAPLPASLQVGSHESY